MFWCFGHEVCGILSLLPLIEPTPPALEGEVLTTGPAGNYPQNFLKDCFLSYNFHVGSNKILFLFKKILFHVDRFKKRYFIEFLTILLLFHVLFF